MCVQGGGPEGVVLTNTVLGCLLQQLRLYLLVLHEFSKCWKTSSWTRHKVKDWLEIGVRSAFTGRELRLKCHLQFSDMDIFQNRQHKWRWQTSGFSPRALCVCGWLLLCNRGQFCLQLVKSGSDMVVPTLDSSPCVWCLLSPSGLQPKTAGGDPTQPRNPLPALRFGFSQASGLCSSPAQVRQLSFSPACETHTCYIQSLISRIHTKTPHGHHPEESAAFLRGIQSAQWEQKTHRAH